MSSAKPTVIVRMGGWALGALLAGPAMAAAMVTAPFVAGAGLKIVYDLALCRPPAQSDRPRSKARATD